MQELATLAQRISALADAAGGWFISSDEVAGIMGIEQVRFWRAVHEVRDRISFYEAIDGWTQETVGELVTVLEQLVGAGPEEQMSRAGLFMPYALGIDLAEEFLFRAQRFSAGHEIRTEELGAMLRHTGSVHAAITIYFNTYVDIDALLEGCAESFRILQGMPLLGRSTAARHLRILLARHILDRQSLFVELQERLRLAAALLGYMDPEDRARADESAKPPQSRESVRRAWARKVMGFDGSAIAPDDLRARYRQLMMRHHPDVDPRGLERCKDVNVAYSLLISEAQGER